MAITGISRDTLTDTVAIVRILSSDNLAAVSTVGYLTAQASNIAVLNNGIFDWKESDFVLVYASDGWGFFSVLAGFASLTPFIFSTSVTGATVVGNFASFASTSGNLIDSGYLPSDATKTRVVMAGSATQINYLAKFVDVNGTVDDTAGPVINAGNISAGISGTAGTVSSFPGTAANGSLILAAVNAGGAFNTTISNGVMGQSTVYSLPDIGAATGSIMVSTTALRVKSVAGAIAAGGAAAQTFVDAFSTAGSNIVGNWATQANAASVLTIVAGNGSFVVTSTANAGVGTFNYIITK